MLNVRQSQSFLREHTNGRRPVVREIICEHALLLCVANEEAPHGGAGLLGFHLGGTWFREGNL